MAISHIIAEKLEAAKKTKSLILNCQRLTDVPDAALDSEWCHQHLQSLHLKNNCIRTMPGERIHLLKSLTQLSLGNNKLEELPSSISMLTEMETLSVVNNQLIQLPGSLGNMNKLRCLFASKNKLSSLPNGLWRAPRLVHVDLHSNLIEEIQPDIIHCQSLETLFLMRNKLCYVPNQIACLPHLNTLAVASNLLECFPLSVTSMSNLQQLSLADNRKLRRIPIDLLKLHNLQLMLSSSVVYTGEDTINPHVISKMGCVPLLQELSARVLRRTLEARNLTRYFCGYLHNWHNHLVYH
ncbi:leucine-rich repeat-containing protein 57-like isoform X2 [Dysidea avara]|uniref:leucine-rich repeat-containing protein 57-like isoform X2 n=1 Tax=Dysidea avara TaxID=196820 RepID=UPI00332998B7